MDVEEGEEVLAFGGGGDGGFGVLEGGEVGEGAVEEPEGAARGAAEAAGELGGKF